MDEQPLAQLGHQQELKRRFSLPALVSLCLCLMATWEATSTVVGTALVSGGSPCLFYNYILSFVLSMCVAASLGEIASIYPTAGGQYHWVAALCPGPGKTAAAYFTGWISVGGQIVFTSSAAFATGLQTQGLIVLNQANYVPARWQGMLLYCSVLACAGALNIYGIRTMPRLSILSGVIHVAGFVGILVTLAVLADKTTSDVVFVDLVNDNGWDNNGVSWLVGLISAVYPFLGYDAACHLAEELPQPSRNVPLAMVGSVLINGVMGLAYVTVLLYSASSTDLENAPMGFSFMQIFLDATNSRVGATVMSAMLTSVAAASAVAGITSTSTTLWAFSRDQATPCHEFLSHISPRLHIPLNAVAVVVVLQVLLGFIYLGNDTAFSAILSMAIVALYLSYLLPILYMLRYGRWNLQPEQYGRFRLGFVPGIVLNLLSAAWMITVMIFSLFPATLPVTPQNMNYSIVVLGGWIVFGLAYYSVRARHKFQVPLVDSNALSRIDPHLQGLEKS
ncbi:Amino acid/polyamine transporter I [Metarhizium album ARSEF 1941]|uniref:Amino acid/polyamine transporter I n=1 Tax=Metarhizium album (strain ARSEF 1941) TaxID=1081103 RepID=A0A0B2WK34_METAS|nr:Amino acid/polyamine transporter I [Metarhizium album ARSEF 1941]KHN93827.1 Amino acid/polyamine transporter I [Metarhizium album ARSEF 1941]